MKSNKAKDRFINERIYIEGESLSEILDVLIKEPEADYFWYSYDNYQNKLTWVLPHHQVVHSESIRVDKEKVKMFLREYKLNKILNERICE